MLSKQEIIDERQANLPLPDQPPVASDWNSSDSRAVNVGSGDVVDDISASGKGSDSLREPVTGASDARVHGGELKMNTVGSGTGREAKDGLEGLPNDVVTSDAKGKAGTVGTTRKDYGYPGKSDPSRGL
ncbi:hypothetical protein K432DRAFT_384890 [Lepidopterella palustris CBS 459.81]|uniref:Uncharacterized protein n=1 Tax=Lepidopterella palustris CBS 459.81 TaxID=1314670 RepID=A0A8E2E4D9_9PEZI|nr:hypothetical protein K432DRAFT_384890 [Lepidopterella palustris CBS 459.81]